MYCILSFGGRGNTAIRDASITSPSQNIKYFNKTHKLADKIHKTTTQGFPREKVMAQLHKKIKTL